MSLVANLSEQALGRSIINARGELERAKAKLAELEAEVVARRSRQVEVMLTQADKQSGTVSFDDGDMLFKGEVSKKVTWDEDRLRAIASGMAWENVEKVFDISFSVPERVFNAITDGKLLKELTDARTVKYGKPVAKFVGFKGE